MPPWAGFVLPLIWCWLGSAVLFLSVMLPENHQPSSAEALGKGIVSMVLGFGHRYEREGRATAGGQYIRKRVVAGVGTVLTTAAGKAYYPQKPIRLLHAVARVRT